MKIYASTLVRKDLSRSIYKNGILLTDYFEKIFAINHNKNFNISLTELRHVISGDKSIMLQTLTDRIKLEDNYYKSKEFYENEEDLYNYAYTKNLFEEDKNLNALSIYKIIMDSDEITYAQISKQFKDISDNKIILDLKQVAHYCKELKKYNLVIVKVKSTKNNERVVVKNKAINMYSDLNSNKFISENNDASDESQISDEEANNLEENLNSSLDTFSKSFYKFSSDPENIMQMGKEEKYFLNVKNQINMNKNYLENRFSYYVDEICIENNILFHLLLKKEKGLTINEITFLLGLHGREKTTNRILSNMEKNNLIKHLNVRKGKKYEFCYTLREDVINKIPKNIIAKYESFEGRKIKPGEDNLTRTVPIIKTKNANPTVKQNEEKKLAATLLDNSTEILISKHLSVKPQNNLDKFLNFSSKKNINTSVSPSAGADILPIKTQENKEIIKKITPEFKCPTQDKITSSIKTNLQDLNMTDFKFIIDQIISNQNLQKIKNSHKLENNSIQLENLSPETKRKILFEYFNAHLSLFKLKSINDVSYNRYIFTLNKINGNKFITVNELKAFILTELESTIGFVIDRRTIKNLLSNLEKLGLIKTLEFELTMRNKLYNYMKNTEITQKKIVSISREIDVNDDVVEKFKEILVTRPTKVTSSEIYFNEHKVVKYCEDEEDFNEMIDRKNINDFFGDCVENSKISSSNNYPIKIEEEIENLTSSLNLKITYDGKKIFAMLEKIIPIEEKYNKKYCKYFFENWKKFYFVKENLVNLFSRKGKKFLIKLDDEYTDQLPIHKIFSNSSLAKVIVPKFLKEKLLKKNNAQNENNYSMKIETIDSYFESSNEETNNFNKNIADLITQRNFEINYKIDETSYNYQMIDYLNLEKNISNIFINSKINSSLTKEEQKFAKKYFTTGLDFNEENKTNVFLMNKRNLKRTNDEENYILYLTRLPQKNITKKDKKFNTMNYKKILDLIPLLRKIYFNPKIKIKKLSNLLPTLSISSDILLYLNKLGIVKLTRDERRIEDNFTNNFNSWEILRNDVSLELDERSLIFFDI